MDKKVIYNDILLMAASVIWGFAFVAQRKGMEHTGPFLFNAARFLLGALVLLPFLKKDLFSTYKKSGLFQNLTPKLNLGCLLFAGASLQQIGIVYTSAGKAGFITGLYVIFVPLLGLFIGRKTNKLTWCGALLAVLGMFFLSINQDFSIGNGDMLVLIGAFFWAFHVLTVDKLSKTNNAISLAFWQFLICSFLSFIASLLFEEIKISPVLAAILPILYAGICSSGIAYTLQVIAQKKAHPSHAAIILGLESPFAAMGGYILLAEILSRRELLGCGLMMAGMLLSQSLYFKRQRS